MAGVCTNGASGAATGADLVGGAKAGALLARSVRAEAGLHSVRLMAGR